MTEKLFCRQCGCEQPMKRVEEEAFGDFYCACCGLYTKDIWEEYDIHGHIQFVGTEEDFEKWKEFWFDTVPKCRDFVCSHDLMSCGIGHACGECSLYETMQRGDACNICTDVGCADCCRKNDCPHLAEKL